MYRRVTNSTMRSFLLFFRIIHLLFPSPTPSPVTVDSMFRVRSRKESQQQMMQCRTPRKGQLLVYHPRTVGKKQKKLPRCC